MWPAVRLAAYFAMFVASILNAGLSAANGSGMVAARLESRRARVGRRLDAAVPGRDRAGRVAGLLARPSASGPRRAARLLGRDGGVRESRRRPRLPATPANRGCASASSWRVSAPDQNEYLIVRREEVAVAQLVVAARAVELGVADVELQAATGSSRARRKSRPWRPSTKLPPGPGVVPSTSCDQTKRGEKFQAPIRLEVVEPQRRAISPGARVGEAVRAARPRRSGGPRARGCPTPRCPGR